MDFLIAIVLGAFLTTGAAATGNLQALCEKGLGGKYTPSFPQTAVDQCPGGRWSNLFKTPK